MANKPGHITKDDVFDDLGLSHSEVSALKVKASLLDAILSEVRRKNYTQAQLTEILDEYQPNVSNLMHGRISQVSIEKLLRYTDRLGMSASIAVQRKSTRKAVASAA